MAPEPVVHLGLYFELPFDLRLPYNHAIHLWDELGSPPLTGWESFDIGDYLGIHSPPPPVGLRPSMTLSFRRWGIPVAEPGGLARRAYAADFPHLIPTRLHRRVRPAPRYEVPVTVVCVDRIARMFSGEFDRWRDTQVDRC